MRMFKQLVVKHENKESFFFNIRHLISLDYKMHWSTILNIMKYKIIKVLTV